MKRRYWHRLPSDPVLQALPLLKWQRRGAASAAADTAALMLLMALSFAAERELDNEPKTVWYSALTYGALIRATGLSRQLIAQGITRLAELGLIGTEGTQQNRRYKIPLEEIGWFKVPCQAIVEGDQIRPFQNFHMRSKVELNALKLYLFLAARRDNARHYAMASYETIFQSTGIPEREVRKAGSFLITSGLLASVDRQHSHITGVNEPNKYYLTGYQQLVNTTS